MKNGKPKISVVMPVYNSEDFVGEAIESIINQTFRDFEFIIVNDGSTDRTYHIINSFYDDRIKIINAKHSGNYVARNLGLSIARGKYICVMDSDDLSLPERFYKQFTFMESHNEIGVCGGYVKIKDSNKIIKPPNNHEEIKVWLLSSICLIHPSIFVRTKLIKMYNLNYNEQYIYASDYDFLVMVARRSKIWCIEDEVLLYRRHPSQISKKRNLEQGIIADQIRLYQLRYFGVNNATDYEKRLHLMLVKKQKLFDESNFEKILQWANFLLKQNYSEKYFNSILLADFFRKTLKYKLKFEIKLITF